MSAPLVSIVIPAHNRRSYLPETLESVFAQRYRPVEVIVIDDGSTDGTREWLESLGDRIRLLTQDAQGVAVARNVASRLATGEYLAFQDDDDLMPPDRIPVLMDALQRFPEAVLATGDYALIDAEGTLTGDRWMPARTDEDEAPRLLPDGQEAILWPRVPAVPHTTLFRTVTGERAGWFDPAFRYACSDADFLARLGRLGPIVYVPRIVSLYRRGHRAIWHDELKANCSRLQLWLKHLDMVSESSPLHCRLLERIEGAVGMIAEMRGAGLRFDDPTYLRFYESAIARLPVSGRLRARVVKRARGKLRRLAGRIKDSEPEIR